MLILAGVTLSVTIGENGIFSQSKQGINKYKQEQAREKLEMAVAEYEMKMRTENLDTILNRVDGCSEVTSVNSNGVLYTVVVDGYIFDIKDDYSIEQKGEDNGIIPEVALRKIEENGFVSLQIEVGTEDNQGIKEIIIIKNGTELIDEKINVNGAKNKTESYLVKGNGEYKAKVVGENGKYKVSEKIEVSSLNITTATLTKGELIDGQITLTVKAQSYDETINKIEILAITEENNPQKVYEKNNYETGTKSINEEATINVPFYGEKTYIAKITDTSINGVETNTQKEENDRYIRTEVDLKKLAAVVNDGTQADGFSGKEIKQVVPITLETVHTVIGTESKPFKGTYNGQEKEVNNIQINNSENFQGLFGYIDGATLKNITLGEGSITAGNRIGGIVGYANNSEIDNVKNNGTVVIATTVYKTSLRYCDAGYGIELGEYGLNVNAVGGICGESENTYIKNSINEVEVSGSSTGGILGGIVGFAKSNNKYTICNCKNKGKIIAYICGGGIVGVTYGEIQIDSCDNEGSIKGGNARCFGGIVALAVDTKITNCKNLKDVSGKASVGGIAGWSGVSNLSYKSEIKNCNNIAEITSLGVYNIKYKHSGSEYNADSAATGGITGISYKTSIEKCNNTGKIKTTYTETIAGVGGIAGDIRNSNIKECFNTGIIGDSTTNKLGNVGGIAGEAIYNCSINNCYNSGQISGGTTGIAGIVGAGIDLDLRYCYNTNTIKGNNGVGGIAGYLLSFEKKTQTNTIDDVYGNNYIYYCYNAGNVQSTNSDYGSINGKYAYVDIDYTYSLKDVTVNNSCWGSKSNAKNATHQGIYVQYPSTSENITEEQTLSYRVIHDFVEKDENENEVAVFKADYEGEQSVNGGFPIFTWQGPKVQEQN